jgi:glycerophosphoryl diester phosphodiesterase/membrane-associated phospholipid phosphatase
VPQPPTRKLTIQQRLGIIGVLMSFFVVLYRLVRSHKIDTFDVAVTTAFQRRRNPLLSRLLHLASWPGFPPQSRIVPWLLPLLWALSGRWTEAVVQMMGWGTGVISAVFKQRMRRPRPHRDRFYFAPARIGGTSFPSGHVINYIGVYGTAAYLASFNIRSPLLRRIALTLTGALLALVGPSRVYLGHHWTTDVTASYLLGTSYVVGLGGVYRYIKEREHGLLERHGQITEPNEFEIVGHGGAGAFHKGNSRDAILTAMQFDIDRIEFDVRQAGDGRIVLVHDPALTMPDGSRRSVDSMTIDEIRRALPGTITFEEAVELIGGRLPIMIDLKLGGFEADLAEAIQRHNLVETAMISCTNPRAIKKLRKEFPRMAIGLSTGYRPFGLLVHAGRRVSQNVLQDFVPYPLLMTMRWSGASAIMIHHHLIAPDVVQFFHEHDFPVYAWTVDNPFMMKWVVSCRVDGVISNRPDQVVDVTRPTRRPVDL